LAPGLLLAIAIALVAMGIAEGETRLLGHPVLEAIVLALVLGVLARNALSVARAAPLNPGATYASKQVLEFSVLLLGASVYLPAIVRAGPALLALVMGGVGIGITAGYSVGRVLGLHSRLAVLVAVGGSICGNSAIAAVAPVIRAEKKDVAAAIGLTAVLGVVMVLSLPLTIALFGLSHYQYGVLAGMSIYAVPQVVAAAFPVSPLSGEVATLVKLTRVLMLGPVVLAMGLLFRRGLAAVDRAAQLDGKSADTASLAARISKGVSAYVPWFVAGFLALAAVRSLGLLPDAVANATREVSRALTVVAIAGLGFGVDLAQVRRVGPHVGAAAVLLFVLLAAFTVVALKLAGIEG
jgi:uncharacterized integral membrane protein (TIGR00698 family)